MEQLIHSAALYCERGSSGHVSAEWLNGVLTLFNSNGLQIREYSMEDNEVCSEGSYPFRDNDPQLYAAVRTGTLQYLTVYCHSTKRRHLLMNWEAVVTMDLSEGFTHLGVPVSCGIAHEELLRQAYALAKPITSWRYGIGYSRSSLKAPCMYAVGIGGGALYPDPDETEEDRERIGCWYREMRYHRRHLEGHFRDVYPANLLSTAHVNVRVGKNKTLLTAGWGEFAPIDEGLWLWTVPDEDIPEARAALLQAEVLLCP
jgi:hypothetical protein